MQTRPLEIVKPCAVCQSADTVTLLYRTATFDVLLCRRCRLAYVNKEFSVVKGEGIPELFRDTYQRNETDLLVRFERDLERIACFAQPPGLLLDVGCGAGNYTLKLLEALPGLDVTLIDLSQPMLTRAVERITQVDVGKITTAQGDIRDLELPASTYDVIFAAAVLHHLRTDAEWETVFAKFFKILKPGGSVWISDLIEHSTPHIQAMMWQRYGEYLAGLKDEAYRDYVFAYIDQEDTPRPLLYQIDLLRQVGFQSVEILHKNSTFAAFGAIKAI